MNRLYILLFSIGIAGILRVESRAQTVVAEDDCEAYTGNNYTDENKGSGFSSPFTFKAWGNDDQGGEFIETGSRKISGNQSFGLYANTSGTGKAVSRPFTTALSGLHRISFRVRFDLNTNNGNKSAGFAICNVPTSSQSNWNEGQRLYLGISGDGLWKYDDGTLKTVTSGGNNFSCNGGDIYLVELDITPSSNTYAFRITNESSSIQSDIISGTLAGSSGSSIASIGFGNGVIGNDQNLIFDDIVVTQNPSNPLPVELVDFQARFDRGSVWLSWRTASEQDNDRFEVEHSVDAKHWATLGAVPGAGYSLQERTYGFRHDQPAAGINYYRLRQVDFDGNSEYSPVVSLEVPRKGAGPVAYPNPFGEQLWLATPGEDGDPYTATVVDWSGRLMGAWTFSSKTGIDAADWPAGVYIVHLWDATGRYVATQRLIK